MTLLVSCGGGNSGDVSDTAVQSSSSQSNPTTSNPATSNSTQVAIADDSNSGPSSPDNVNAQLITGQFIDGLVEGLSYRTETQVGVTNAQGEYHFLGGESITFSIGELAFPTVTAAEFMTPFQLSNGSANPLATTLNIARLLQSLDEDANPLNGILIPNQAALSATPINFDVGLSEFENNTDVINLVANSGSINTVLISPADMP